ncbi:uncharacterized protein METZ01_LOCUS317092, partial [marine metagenome]
MQTVLGLKPQENSMSPELPDKL